MVCVLMVEGMSVVVIAILSLMSVMSPPPAIDAHGGYVIYFGCFRFMGELGILDCDDIYMCLVDKYFELLEFVFNSVYVDLKYNEISLIFNAGSVCLCGGYSHVLVLSMYVSGYLGTLCGCIGCGDCNARTVIYGAYDYGERV